jgi:hypothetical protein
MPGPRPAAAAVGHEQTPAARTRLQSMDVGTEFATMLGLRAVLRSSGGARLGGLERPSRPRRFREAINDLQSGSTLVRPVRRPLESVGGGRLPAQLRPHDLTLSSDIVDIVDLIIAGFLARCPIWRPSAER